MTEQPEHVEPGEAPSDPFALPDPMSFETLQAIAARHGIDDNKHQKTLFREVSKATFRLKHMLLAKKLRPPVRKARAELRRIYELADKLDGCMNDMESTAWIKYNDARNRLRSGAGVYDQPAAAVDYVLLRRMCEGAGQPDATTDVREELHAVVRYAKVLIPSALERMPLQQAGRPTSELTVWVEEVCRPLERMGWRVAFDEHAPPESQKLSTLLSDLLDDVERELRPMLPDALAKRGLKPSLATALRRTRKKLAEEKKSPPPRTNFGERLSETELAELVQRLPSAFTDMLTGKGDDESEPDA